MSLFLLFGSKNINKMIGDVEIDAVIEESLLLESEVTEHPIETGSLISDHVIVYPRAYRMRGVIGSNSLSLIGGQNRRQDVYEALILLRDTRQIFTVVSGLDTFENLTFVSLEFPRTINNSTGLEFRAELREVVIVSTEREDFGETAEDGPGTVDDEATAPGASRATKDLASSEVRHGRQSVEAPSAQVESGAGSLLSKILGVGA
ncbi:MAG: hypothetical protein IBX56_02335 [Methylomicrobium sp.]|nr:hypothetical protein [Methylomicrobium sp.]